MDKNTLITVLIILILVLIIPMTKYALGFYNEKTITATVVDKERINKDQSSYYLVYTDKEVFTVRDSWIKLRWNSSDVYGDIEIGKTYNFTVFGWRSGFMSWYRNIIDYKEV